MKAALTILFLFIFAMFIVAAIINIPTFFTAVQGATTSILLTADGGDTWYSLEQVEGSEELEKANILFLSYNPSDTEVIYAGTDGRGLYKSIDGGETWNKVVDQNNSLSPSARTHSVAFGPAYADREQGLVEIIYVAALQNGAGQILRSQNGGFTFEQVYTTSKQNAPVYFVSSDPANSAVLWAGTGEGLLVRSLDSGETWEKIYQFNDSPSTFFRNGNELMVVSTTGRLYISSSNGSTWQEIQPRTANGGVAGRVYSVSQDPSQSSTVYLSTNSGLLRTDNFGRYFGVVDIAVSGDDLPVRAVSVSPVARNVIFVAAGRNMYISEDGGQRWRVRHLAIGRSVNIITPHPSNPAFILVGTHK